jgi:3-hydroxyisobutyrate dehydrogenase
MARSMARAGLSVRGWNRTASKAEPLAADGITVAGTAREAAAGADVLLTMLFDADSVEAALADVDAPPGTLWLQTSTVGVEGAERLASVADKRGWRYVDSPVLGTKQPAEQGNLVVLASGADDVRDDAAPVFDAIGRRTQWVGPAGAGSRLKLAVNAWIAMLTVGTAQSIALAKGLGVDPANFLEAIDGSATDSPYAHLKGKLMMAGDFAPSFTVEGAAKDARLIAAAAASAGVNTMFVDAVAEAFGRAGAQGHGDEDMAAVLRVIEAG